MVVPQFPDATSQWITTVRGNTFPVSGGGGGGSPAPTTTTPSTSTPTTPTTTTPSTSTPTTPTTTTSAKSSPTSTGSSGGSGSCAGVSAWSSADAVSPSPFCPCTHRTHCTLYFSTPVVARSLTSEYLLGHGHLDAKYSDPVAISGLQRSGTRMKFQAVSLSVSSRRQLKT